MGVSRESMAHRRQEKTTKTMAGHGSVAEDMGKTLGSISGGAKQCKSSIITLDGSRAFKLHYTCARPICNGYSLSFQEDSRSS